MQPTWLHVVLPFTLHPLLQGGELWPDFFCLLILQSCENQLSCFCPLHSISPLLLAAPSRTSGEGDLGRSGLSSTGCVSSYSLGLGLGGERAVMPRRASVRSVAAAYIRAD